MFLVWQVAINKGLGNPTWPRVPEAALQHCSLKNLHALCKHCDYSSHCYLFHFPDHLQAPRALREGRFIAATDQYHPLFYEWEKRNAGNSFEGRAEQSGELRCPGALPLAFNKRQTGRELGLGHELTLED